MAAALAEIQTASRENDQRVIATAFSPENIVPLRTLDGATATMTDVANFIGTLVLDLRAGEVRKG
ncbi:MAG TPA: hypothetical protein VGN93_13320 [Shinella sp.]|uniref:hypothetical protein n=1 Tax=Shinella sp. TaxID=1870904 RepID=UPI002E10D528|nr:hypothetical protein [Shinella sp.]